MRAAAIAGRSTRFIVPIGVTAEDFSTVREEKAQAVPKWIGVPLWNEAAGVAWARIPRQVFDHSPLLAQTLPAEQPRGGEGSSRRSSSPLQRVAASPGSNLPLPRLLIVFAHPDDEVLAMGARLERLAASQLFTVTDGAPEDGNDARHHGFTTLSDYRGARRDELAAALGHAGISLAAVSSRAASSPFPVPDQTAALNLPALTRAVAKAIAIFAPEAVLTHPYEGGHPDHDACAFAVHSAVRLLNGEHGTEPKSCTNGIPMPVILETPSYHAGESGSMQTGTFLETWASAQTIACELSAQEQANKEARLACFVSQAGTLAQFGTARELFREAPHYDFTEPPHAGQLFFEQFAWGMSGERFRLLAAEASRELRLSSPVRAQPNVESDRPL